MGLTLDGAWAKARDAIPTRMMVIERLILVIDYNVNTCYKNKERRNSPDIQGIKFLRSQPGANLTSNKYNGQQGQNELPVKRSWTAELPDKSADRIY